MRLINTETWKMQEFFDNDVPKYAILSHRWEKEEEELTYQDFEAHRTHGQGYRKVKTFCELARTHFACEWAWVDTCCIDKKSSADLSEAINTMYRWYENSYVCVVYLSDVTNLNDLGASRWFTRGWTLQEFIAPKYQLVMFNKEWTRLGTRDELAETLAEITKVPLWIVKDTPDKHVLYETIGSPVLVMRIYEKMRWAARRCTSRVEDVAYCLMGLFNINMPLLYGEGDNAFLRLQQKIIESSVDESIFVWHSKVDNQISGILAPNPDAFAYNDKEEILQMGTYDDISKGLSRRGDYQITNRGLRMRVHLFRLKPAHNNDNNDQRSELNSPSHAFPLRCTVSLGHYCSFPLLIRVIEDGPDVYYRYGNPIQVTDEDWATVLEDRGEDSFESLLTNTPVQEIYLRVSASRIPLGQ